MTAVWTLVTLWVGLALIAGLLSVWLRVSTALTEIIVGTVAQLIIGSAVGAPWPEARRRIGRAIRSALRDSGRAMVLLEGSAGGTIGFGTTVRRPGFRRPGSTRSKMKRTAAN